MLTTKQKTFWKKWIKALKSGEYTHCKDKLNNTYTNQFCALGVSLNVLKATYIAVDDGGAASYNGWRKILEEQGMDVKFMTAVSDANNNSEDYKTSIVIIENEFNLLTTA